MFVSGTRVDSVRHSFCVVLRLAAGGVLHALRHLLERINLVDDAIIPVSLGEQTQKSENRKLLYVRASHRVLPGGV